MGMVSIGPLAIPNGAFAGLLAFLTFTILVSVAKRRVDAKLERWSTIALVVGVITARLVYVALHWATFSANPLRAFMLWQGGFEWIAGAVAAVISTLFVIRPWRTRGLAIAILGASALVWIAAGMILNGAKTGVPLPDVTLTDSSGANIELRAYASGPVVVNMWATWCPPCRRELPAMEKQAAQNPDLPFLFINQAEEPALVQAYLTQQSLNLKHVLFDTHSQLARELRTTGLPMTLFFYDGILTDIHAGEISPEALSQKTATLLGKKHAK